jgi:ribA/ribD-fused uncharacterized protein
MFEALLAKFTQHKDLAHLLENTGKDILVENNPYDAFWGNGHDGRGRNTLGSLLMLVRDQMNID